MGLTHFINKNIAYLSLFIIAGAGSSASGAEEIELNLFEAQAHYTYEVSKQLTWPNEDSLTQFNLAVIGNSSELIDAFKKRNQINIRGKFISIVEFNMEDFIAGQYSIVFVPYNKRSFNNKLYRDSENVLIVAEGRVKKSVQMVNLLVDNDRIKLKFNRENLIDKGFAVSANLLDFAGTRQDLSQELKEREVKLTQLLQDVSNKQEELEKVSSELKNNSQKLSAAQLQLQENNQKLTEYRNELNNLRKEIEYSKAEVAKNNQDIQRQEQLLIKSRQELQQKAKSVSQLQIDIEQNERILDEQENKLSMQRNMIETRDETIDEQRSWLKANAFIIMLFIVMTIFLLKINSLRRSANRELKSANNKLFELATTDGLTGLFNRRHFLEQAQKELLRNKRNNFTSVMLMMDIDHFKNVNDTYGHLMGDTVIKTVGDILLESMRKYDIVGRLGGEEYAMMLMDCDIKVAQDIAKRLCERIEQTEFSTNEYTIKNVTVSIGLSEVTESDVAIEYSMIRSDKALYQAKQAGRNQVHIS
ncbi:MAG: YfiR/HmsC family protein [Kangiellaceae bacterium]|nr:YfiR/HmsC family protein [Kangiellaceae bacterium]